MSPKTREKVSGLKLKEVALAAHADVMQLIKGEKRRKAVVSRNIKNETFLL